MLPPLSVDLAPCEADWDHTFPPGIVISRTLKPAFLEIPVQQHSDEASGSTTPTSESEIEMTVLA